MAYLLKRNDVYYLRVKIPSDLSRWFPDKREIRKSLRTKDRRQAKVCFSGHLGRTERTFALMRAGIMTDSEIKKLAADYLRETLERSDRERLEHGSRNYFDAEVGHWLSSVPYQDLSEEPTKVLRGCTSQQMETSLANFLESKGITSEVDSVKHKKLLREISHAHLEALRIDERRDLGDFSDEYYLEEEKETISQRSQPESQRSVQPLILSGLIKLYSDEKLAQGRWTPKTQHEVTASLNIFVGILGDIAVETLTRANMVECLTKVRTLKVKDKLIEERTVKKHMTHMSSLLKWGVRNGHINRNPAEGLAPTIHKAPSEERSIYSKEDLRRLLDGLISNRLKEEDKPERYWIPLVALFSGLRLDEVCQLYREDITQIQGVWCFDVNRAKDKKLKNTASIRQVPIHSKLIELGFLEYHQSVKHERLWPNINRGRDGYAHLFGKWYQRFNRSCITEDKRKVFHSFRHTFTDTLKQAGVQEQLIAELVGHTTGSITAERYGKKFNPQVLSSAVESLRYELEF